MAKSRKLLYWVFHHFHVISIVFFICAYSIGFGLGGSDNNFYLGLILLTFYMVFSLSFLMIKSRSCLTRSISIFTAIFWLTNLAYMIISSPKIEDVAYHDGTAYLLTHHQHVLEPQFEGFSLTKWNWGTFPHVVGIPGRWGREAIIYDEKMRLVGVTRFSMLVYTDGGDPRTYDNVLEHDGYIYYSSSKCIDKNDLDDGYYTCEIDQYSIFRCNLDNTSCILIPFQYTGYTLGSELIFNQETQEINFYITQVDRSEILVYSYGPQPCCYIDGCEILEQP